MMMLGVVIIIEMLWWVFEVCGEDGLFCFEYVVSFW